MKAPYLCLVTLLATSAFAQTAPLAPSLTAGPFFKGLQFDWDPVAGATRYELGYKPNQNAAYVQLGNDLPASATSFRYRFPLHLIDWTDARYRVAACNSIGCTNSNEVSVSDLRRDAVGYFKTTETTARQGFGRDTAISPDGLNFAAAANGETVETPEGARQMGAVYVFRRGSNGEWVQRARLLPTVPLEINTGTNDMEVDISADGNTVVLGMPNYLRDSLGEEELDDESGEVFVFNFNGTSWTRARLYTGANQRGRFGSWVGINDSGDIIAVDAGNVFTQTVPRNTFIYRKTNGSWQPVRAIRSRAGAEFCAYGALSGDGSTIVEACREGTLSTTLRSYVRTHSGPNWTVREEIPLELVASTAPRTYTIGIATDDSGDTIAAQVYEDWPDDTRVRVEVMVFKRDGAYSMVDRIVPFIHREPDDMPWFGMNIALSGDGGTIAVGDARDNTLGAGPVVPRYDPTTSKRGAVNVYRRRTSGRYALFSVLKPNYSANELASTFGLDVSLNFNGLTLIVGHTRDNSSATGIGGNWANGDTLDSGAVFLY